MVINFKKLPVPESYGAPIFDIYIVYENNRSKVMEKFRTLSDDKKDFIKDLICRMATVSNFRSPSIKYNLRKYNYGEIKPLPHRFFFFQQCGNNYIFFEYILKKKDSFNDNIYKKINEKKIRYEKEFEKFIQGC
jgi:hypothetical protein